MSRRVLYNDNNTDKPIVIRRRGAESMGCRDMKATSLAFVFNKATAVVLHIEKHFGKKILEVFFIYSPRGVGVVEAREADVEGGTELVSTRVNGVSVYTPQPFYGMRRAEQTCDENAVRVGTTACERVDETGSYVVQASLGFRNQKRERVSERVYGIELIACHHYNRSGGEVGIAEGPDRTYPELFGRGILIFVGIVEHFSEPARKIDMDSVVVADAGLDDMVLNRLFPPGFGNPVFRIRRGCDLLKSGGIGKITLATAACYQHKSHCRCQQRHKQYAVVPSTLYFSVSFGHECKINKNS